MGRSIKVFLVALALQVMISGCASRYDNKPSTAGLEEGVSAFERNDFGLAYTKLKPLADAGIPMAQNILGRMYLHGDGVPLNQQKALAMFNAAAESGLPNAQNNLGTMYSSGQGVRQDHAKAVFWFQKAANQGFEIAMENLANMYEAGLGVKRDIEAAKKWRLKSQGVNAGSDRDAIEIKLPGQDEYTKGLSNYYAWNFTEAAKWFQKAAENNHPEAMLKLAWLYQHGQGVEKNDVLANMWYQKAKEYGYSLEDGGDRLMLIDVPHEQVGHALKSQGIRPTPEPPVPIACGCPQGTPFGKCECSVSPRGDCSCTVNK